MIDADRQRRKQVAERGRVLFFEPTHEGHIALHVSQLVRGLAEHDAGFDAVFAVPEALLDRLDDDVRECLTGGHPRIALHPLEPATCAPCEGPRAIAKGLARWRLACRVTAATGSDHVFFLTLDNPMVGALASNPFGAIRQYSGILFRPRLHLHRRRSMADGPLATLKRLRQYPYYAAALIHPRLSRVWSLDPLFPAYAARRLPGGHKVRFLSEGQVDGGGKPVDAEPHRTASRFLMFGALKRRKGLMTVLDALDRFDAQDWQDMEVRLIGRVEGDLAAEVHARVERLKGTAGEALMLHDAFVSDEQLSAEMDAANVFLAPYIGHIGSSGVIFNAATRGKPVLAPAEGLLGALTEQYRLGLAVDSRNPDALAQAMRAMTPRTRLRDVYDPAGQAEYVALNARPWVPTVLTDLATALDLSEPPATSRGNQNS